MLSFEVGVMKACFLCHHDCIACLHDIFETCPNCELLLLQNQSPQVQDNVRTINPEIEILTNSPLAFEIDAPLSLDQHTDLVSPVSFNVGYLYLDAASQIGETYSYITERPDRPSPDSYNPPISSTRMDRCRKLGI
jgi:hypothetical protein